MGIEHDWQRVVRDADPEQIKRLVRLATVRTVIEWGMCLLIGEVLGFLFGRAF